MSVNEQIVNAPSLYINGLDLFWVSANVITATPGAARSSDNTTDIIADLLLTMDVTDVTLANSSLYGLYVIGDSLNYNLPYIGYALADAVPVFRPGYDCSRRIGNFRTDVSGNIIETRWISAKSNSIRTAYYYVTGGISALSGGASTTFASVSLASLVPTTSRHVILQAVFTPNVANHLLQLKAGDAGSGVTTYIAMNGQVATVPMYQKIDMPTSATSTVTIQYLVSNGSDAVTLNVLGYVDYL